MIFDSISVVLVSSGPAPAWTKHGVIYIKESASPAERKVLLRHELGHILYRHTEQAEKLKHHPELSNIAGDGEIAISLYDQDDLDVMNAPRSMLKNAITPEWVEKNAPGCATYVEIYDHLKKNSIEIDVPAFCKMSQEASSQNSSKRSNGSITPREVKEILKKLESSLEQQATYKQAETRRAVAPRRGIEDAFTEIATEALARIPSYRRPARRGDDSFLRKGKSVKLTRPKVTVYVDRSGSFTPEKTADAEKALTDLAERYSAIVDMDTFRFSDCVYRGESNTLGGRGTNYIGVAAHIIQEQPRLAIVITDNDSCETLPELPAKTKIYVKVIGAHSSAFGKKANATIVT